MRRKGYIPALIILPQGRVDQLQAWLHTVIDEIERRAADDGEHRGRGRGRIVIYEATDDTRSDGSGSRTRRR